MNRNSNNYRGLLINYLIKKKFPFLVNEITAARGLNVLNNNMCTGWMENLWKTLNQKREDKTL